MALLEIEAAQLTVRACGDVNENCRSALSGLFEASASGDPLRVRDALLTLPPTADLNERNTDGDTAVHLAAACGSVASLEALEERGADLHQLNAQCENGLHVACRLEDLRVAAFFADRAVCLDGQNREGETPLHLASGRRHLAIVRLLCRAGAGPNVQDRCLRTPLLLVAAAASGDGAGDHCAQQQQQQILEVAKALLQSGARMDLADRQGWGPLRCAIQRENLALALVLISAGAPVDQTDRTEREGPLHAACRAGHLPVAQALCAYGCAVDPVNSHGLTPLHLAARAGHLEVARCLLLAGANPQLASREGVLPEVMALAQGHKATAGLLGKMRPERRAVCVEQLVPTQRQLPRIKLKIFGHSACGKTSLVDSLRSNRITGFLRRTFRGATTEPADGRGGGIAVSDTDEDIAADGRQCFRLRQRSMQSELNFDAQHEAYTRGIAVQSLSLAGAGDFSVWDFSGYEPYFVFYDHFIGDTSCVHAILFSLAESYEVMRQRAMFWLQFLLARLPAREPLGYCGKPRSLARLLLVATHADTAAVFRSSGRRGLLESAEAERLLCEMRELTQYRLEVCPEVFVVDTSEAMSAEMKALRQQLAEWRFDILRQLPCSNGFFDAVSGRLGEWTGDAQFPVFSWQQFVDNVRTKVNPLCSDDHMKDLVQELQYTGDVVYLESEVEQDMIVLSPQWLCSSILGFILSHDNISQARVTGSFSTDDVQFMTGETQPEQLVRLLSAMDMCTVADLDDEVQFEFPCLNFLESGRSPWVQAATGQPEDAWLYAGMQVRAARSQLVHIFPRLQCRLRRSLRRANESVQIDLFQWFHGSKLTIEAAIECLLRLEDSDQVIRLRARGPPSRVRLLFGIYQDLANLLEQTIDEMCPGLECEAALLSPREVSEHGGSGRVTVTASQGAVFRAMLDHRRRVLSAEAAASGSLASFPPPSIPVPMADGADEEELENLICFGSRQLLTQITLGPDLPVSALKTSTLQRLCRIFDPPDPLGNDWCLLAVRLGLTQSVPRVHSANEWLRSRTAKILDEWSRGAAPGRTLGALVDVFREMGRSDASDLLVEQAPMYLFTPGIAPQRLQQ